MLTILVIAALATAAAELGDAIPLEQGATELSAVLVAGAACPGEVPSNIEATASDSVSTAAAGSECSASAEPSMLARELLIPKLTPVKIQILVPLGSKLSKTGEMFPIRLAEPVVMDGVEAIPAGAAGMGEVIHAKKSGGMGAAGELVVTARYLEVDGRQLLLRSMHWAQSGKSKIDTVNALNVASVAAPLPIGLVGYFIGGGQVNVAEGAIADAKTAADFAITLRSPAEDETAAADAAVPAEETATAPGTAPVDVAEAQSAPADTHKEDGE